MKRKTTVKTLTAALAAGMVLGCGTGSVMAADMNKDGTVNNPDAVEIEKGNLAFWSMFSGGDGEYMDQIIKNYNETDPAKKVQSVMLVWADYYTKLQTAVAAGKGPDIGVSHASKLAELVDQGVIEPLTPYLEELDIDMEAMYSEKSLESVTFDGEIYAMPLDTHAGIIFYNKDIMEEAGVELTEEGNLDIQSEEDFLEILDKCKAVMGDGESAVALMDAKDDPYRVWWSTYFQMGGSQLVNEEGTEVTLDKEVAVKAAEFVKKMFDEGYSVPGIDDPMQYFQSGKAAMYIGGGTWGTGTFEKVEGLNFGAQVWPKMFENDSCWADSHTFILPVSKDRSEEDSKAAVEFMANACSEGALTWAGSGQIPSNISVVESEEYLSMPHRNNYKTALETAVMPTKNPAFYPMKAGIIECLDSYWAGSTDAEGAIEELYAELEANLQ